MDKPRPRAMDITPAQRRNEPVRRAWRPTRRQILLTISGVLLVLSLIVGLYSYKHRNDQVVMSDRYQVVYLLTGQVYFGKLQDISGEYLTLKNVYTLENNASEENASDTNILQVSRQVYGPEDSMAIRADQVQFWQNLRSDSKVAQAIDSVNK